MRNRRAKPTSPATRARGIGISNVLFLLAGMALMALLGFVKPSLSRHPVSVPVSNPSKDSLPAVHASWGELEYSRFALTQPEGYLPNGTTPFPAPAWYFEKTTREQLSELFNSVDTSPAMRQLLLDTNRWQTLGETVLFNPTSELILGLGRPARERIYSRLSSSPLNMPQHYPFRFRGDGFDEWFARSKLTQEKLELVRSLIYTNRGGSICLADIDVLQEKLGPDDFRQLFESLYSEQSLFLSLRIKPTTDVNALARYWGRGGREQEVLTILKSMAKTPDGGSINVAYLLPSFARLRLYTFAPATNDSVITGQDCFWTALNFFKSESEVRPPETNSADVLVMEYPEKREAPSFGDVIAFVENRKLVHACVYIADDVVFTKNGVNYHQPWVLMKMSDLRPRYTTDRPLTVAVLRPKSL